MTVRRVYLDHNASAPLLPAARAAMLASLSADANPSSVHAEGRAARRVIEDARQAVAALVGGRAGNVIFTSGATEAATMLLTPDWQTGRGPARFSRLYVSAADHPCLLGGGRFSADRRVTIGVDGNGVADLAGLERALLAHDRQAGLPLVAIHLANNETGVIQPARAIGDLVRRAGGVLVLDAVQAAGRIALDIEALGADFLILSSHKIGGPKGSGAVVAASDRLMPTPLVAGGGQEKGFRGGTENLPGIAGFGAAALAAIAALAEADAVRARRDRLEAGLRAAAGDVTIFGAAVERLPNTSFFALPGLKAETAQIAFDLAGIALSAGSACSSGKVGPSHVLKAMGAANGGGALRVSIGPATTDEEIGLFSVALAAILARRTSASRAA